jgi:tRNA-2-methylthio-N6-dimethylallyladenosine synthase
MRRGYTSQQYRQRIGEIRDRIPNVSLSADLIVGFCGESEEQFERTAEMVRDVRFDKLHTAAYSTRPGTIASRTQEDDVPAEEKQRRLKIVDELQERISSEINAGLQGQTQRVLVEGRRRGSWYGRTRNDKLVFFDDEGDRQGEVVDVVIDRTSPWSLRGTLVGVGAGAGESAVVA